MNKDTVLVTGGLGYIGSHIVLNALEKNHKVIIIDNLQNSKIGTLDVLEAISKTNINFFKADIRSREDIFNIFSDNNISSVIHCAGLKSVTESFERPLDYYDINFNGLLNLLLAMKKFDVNNLIFSSSATVYGNPDYLPIDESHKLQPLNPYGQSKLFAEKLIKDFTNSNRDFNSVILRYFNPIGSHQSGLIGDNPKNEPTNIMPLLCYSIIRDRHFTVHGLDYDTHDGTGIRDYIHISDLSEAHLLAEENITSKKLSGVNTINLGSGHGHSVFELIKALEKHSNSKLKIVKGERRAGDITSSYANNDLAQKKIGWKPNKSIDEMCLSSLNYYKNFI